MEKEEKLIREYFEFKDINQSEAIEVLPLTLVDILLEYEDIAIINFIDWFLENRTGKYDPENLRKSILEEYQNQ